MLVIHEGKKATTENGTQCSRGDKDFFKSNRYFFKQVSLEGERIVGGGESERTSNGE